jgi:FkbM family methyltransferase
MLKDPIRRLLARALSHPLLRRGVVRLGRFLSNAGRLDMPYGIEENGEAWVQEIVTKRAAARPIRVMDIGVFKGWWTESLLRVAGTQQSEIEVLLFEPSPRIHDALQDKLESWDTPANLELIQCALSDRQGTAQFHFVEGQGGSDSLHKHALFSTDLAVADVTLNTVDAFCAERGIEQITLLKSDTEGNDLPLLRGAAGMLERQQIEVIQIEYSHIWVTSGCFLKEAMELLQGYGYAFGKVTPRGIEFYDGWHPELETFQLGNYLACLPSWRDRFPQVEWWNTSGG